VSALIHADNARPMLAHADIGVRRVDQPAALVGESDQHAPPVARVR